MCQKCLDEIKKVIEGGNPKHPEFILEEVLVMINFLLEENRKTPEKKDD